jgi:5-methylcytosine-specific restriction endonuclease McrA
MPSGVYVRTKQNRLNIGIAKKRYFALPENRLKMSIAKKGFLPVTHWKKGHISWNKGLKGFMAGALNNKWKGGISKDKEWIKERRKIYRHKLGISKSYNLGLGISKTKEYKKFQRQKRKALIKGGGELTLKTIQQVYEDNIKQYGTLTCYLCLLPIEFKQDSLEHKIPLSRGGTNEYSNLAVAHFKCNCKKHTKTELEYRKES